MSSVFDAVHYSILLEKLKLHVSKCCVFSYAGKFYLVVFDYNINDQLKKKRLLQAEVVEKFISYRKNYKEKRNKMKRNKIYSSLQ